jgi:hypothetical protein
MVQGQDQLVHRFVSFIDCAATRENIPVFKPRYRDIYAINSHLIQQVDALCRMRGKHLVFHVSAVRLVWETSVVHALFIAHNFQKKSFFWL